jgi:hypothetical protein
MQINTKLRIFNKLWLLKLQSMTVPKEITVGVSARIPHTTDFIPLMDYDNIKDERLVEESTYLQELFTLGDFHFFSTNEFGLHVACIDRLRLKEALDVVNTSTCDAVFKRGVRINEFRTWILRALEKGNRPKPKYLYTLQSPYNGQRLQSQAHGLFLQRYYGAKVRLVNPDGNYELEVQGYKTSSKISLEDLK